MVSVATVVLLTLLGGAGASSSGGDVLIGIPSVVWIVLAIVSGILVWRRGLGSLAGFLIPVAGMVAAAWSGRLPSLMLFSGRPLLVFVLASVVLALSDRATSPPKALLFPVFFAIYSFGAYQAQIQVGPDGDEPQYLMVAQSLIQDHDLALDQDFKEKRYEAFFSRPLKPDFRIRGPQGQIYSLHAIGLSLLILPAYAFGGYPGASFFMALLAALLVRELRRLLFEVGGDERLAEGTAWLVGLSPPIIHFAGLIFTEIPAALLVCVGLRHAHFARSRRSAVIAALCAAALPWFNVRYAILSMAITGALLWRLISSTRISESWRARSRAFVSPFAILVVSALAIGLFHFELWGFFDPRRVYGKTREFSLSVLPEGLPGLFFDQEFGLFVYAPIFVLSIGGFVLLWRRHRAFAVACLVAFGGVIAVASVWPMWRGGFNPPSRFLVPLVSILASGLALSLQRGVRPATALLAGWSLWCGIGGAMNIDMVHRDREGIAPYFRTQSGAREWTSPLPSFVLSEDRPTRLLMWPWAALLCLPVALIFRSEHGRKPIRNRDTLLATTAFISVALWADHLSPRVREPERDATRLLGQPVVSLPAMQFDATSEASWPVDVFYEPHRFPDGRVVAELVPFSPGSYTLELATDGGSNASPPSVSLSRRLIEGSVLAETKSTAGSLSADFTIAVAGDYDIRLAGGEPFVAKRATLRVAHR